MDATGKARNLTGVRTASQQRKYLLRRAQINGTAAKGVLVARSDRTHSLGRDAFGINRPLAARTLALESGFQTMAPDQTAKALNAIEGQAEVMEMVRQIVLERKMPEPGGVRNRLVRKHLALHLAAGLLDVDADQSDWLLIAASMKGRPPGSRKALLRQLEHGETDESSFEAMFAPALESSGEPERLRKMLFAARRNPRLLGAVLRQALGLNAVQAFRRRNVDPEQLARDILACGENPELLGALAESLEGLDGNAPQMAQMLKSVRGDGRKLSKLWLRAHQAAGAASAERDELRCEVQAAIKELELLDGDQIRGSYNALDAAIDGPEPARFLDAYGEITSEKSTKFTAVLRNMLKFYALDDINVQIDRTKKALGDDLRAERSSSDKAHLSEILDSLSSMHLSTSFLMMVDEFEEKLAGAAARAKVEVPPVNGTMMVLGLLDVIDSGSSQPSQFETLLAKLGLDCDAWTEIFTLQGIKEILRTMPDRIYDSIRGLGKLQEAAQTVLEAAILREEAAAPAP
ncbi:TyeA family type III secretion system gatekeeper subunit [Noviherbaspirillum suwonense]|uniref:TyeA protein n=1 Tax=Noviherbaspirillum suwonense TaxID=1224511 RepID=A0ABY1PTJ4_9BURK|nr:TyeA family type III secretion system gatekeeper subunit [Noviherbaspirillum suwonense]SMP44714.1 TyeA protein [Noviherbaspirillum suwonense]